MIFLAALESVVEWLETQQYKLLNVHTDCITEMNLIIAMYLHLGESQIYPLKDPRTR